MTLRSRLAWAFTAMLLVPLAMLLLVGALVRLWLDPSGGPGFSLKDDLRAVEVLNTELRRDPLSVLEGEGFDRLMAAVPRGVSLGIWADNHWVRTTAGFNDASLGPPWARTVPPTVFVWQFEPAPGREAKLEARWSPREAFAAQGAWLVGGIVGLLTLLVLTNIVLTWLVSRSVLRPLGQLAAAAHRLGEGDLSPGPLPKSPPEFYQVGMAFDDLRQRLWESLNEQRALEEERRTWVASVSHDLRTPLAAIRGYAEGLRDGVASTPEKQARYQDVIVDRALQLERQVDDLFQWARWDWGHPKLRLQTLDLTEELRAAVNSWGSDWPDLEVFWMSHGGPCPLVADPVALRRIFDNLARNVVQHGGQYPRLHVALGNTVSGYEVSFRDEGPGLGAEVLPRVFERFFRGDPARNPGQGGGGLGLTIAKTLVEALGGGIRAGNHAEGGAVFTLSFRRGNLEEQE